MWVSDSQTRGGLQPQFIKLYKTRVRFYTRHNRCLRIKVRYQFYCINVFRWMSRLIYVLRTTWATVKYTCTFQKVLTLILWLSMNKIESWTEENIVKWWITLWDRPTYTDITISPSSSSPLVKTTSRIVPREIKWNSWENIWFTIDTKQMRKIKITSA